MPNWCSNKVLINGPNEDMEILIAAVISEDSSFSLAKILVPPEELLNEPSPMRDKVKAAEFIKKYGTSSWYDWQNDKWGTKWDVHATTIYDRTEVTLPGGRTVLYEFDSAWAPPLPVYLALAERFPNTNIYACYDEPGMDFSGWCAYSKGELVKEGTGESYDALRMYMEPSIDIFDYVLR